MEGSGRFDIPPDPVQNHPMRVPACILLSLAALTAAADPPLRLALSAGADGLRTAQDWNIAAESFRARTGVGVEPLLAATGEAILRSLDVREAEAAVLDAAVYLRNRDRLRILGIAVEFGSPYERFLLAAGADSVIHRPEDLSRARLVLASGPGSLPWDLPLAWARRYRGPASGASDPRPETGYEGVLRSIALDLADAGFLPEGFLEGRKSSALADRVRIVAATPPYPLAVLVARRDLAGDRAALAERLLGLSAGAMELRSPPPDLESVLSDLEEALRASGP